MRPRVHGQRVQLVHRDAPLPVAAQLAVGVQIPVHNRAVMRRAEQLEHRDVGQRVPAVRRRVNEPRALRPEQQVARPQVAVDARQRGVLVFFKQRIACLLDDVHAAAPEIPRPQRLLGEWQHALLHIELGPSLGGLARLLASADEVGAVPPVRGRAERGRPHGVDGGQLPAGLTGGVHGRAGRIHLFDGQRVRVLVQVEHLHHRGGALPQPAQVRGLRGCRSRRAAVLHKRVRHRCPPFAVGNVLPLPRHGNRRVGRRSAAPGGTG